MIYQHKTTITIALVLLCLAGLVALGISLDHSRFLNSYADDHYTYTESGDRILHLTGEEYESLLNGLQK